MSSDSTAPQSSPAAAVPPSGPEPGLATAAHPSESLFRALFTTSLDAVLITAPDGRVLAANPAACRLFGRSAEDLCRLGRAGLIDPADARLAAALEERQTRGSFNGELRFVRSNGEMFEGEVSSAVFPSDGEDLRTSIVIRDVSARKRAELAQQATEARFRLFFECAPVPLWEEDFSAVKARLAELGAATGDAVQALLRDRPDEIKRLAALVRIVDCNTCAWTFLGAASREDLGATLGDSFDERSYAKFGEELVSLARGETRFTCEVPVRTLQGTAKELLLSLHVAPGAEGTWARIYVSAVDLTERKRAEEQSRQLEAQLRHSQKLEAVGTLAGGIAHDFNNILSGMVGFTSLARDLAADNPELLDYLDEISRSGRRAAELVGQILSFSRTHGDDDSMGTVELGDVVEEATRLLRATSPSTIEFSQTLEADLPPVQGNATQLHQVLMNLGTNALHAMQERPGRLSISLNCCRLDDDQVRSLPDLKPGLFLRLAVTDTGRGMDLATQQRVFEPFFTTKPMGEGTGLGLSVVHGIIRDHHGAIQLFSELNRGTTFEVFLPAVTSAPVPEPQETCEPIRGQGERILFVDDDEIVAHAGKLTLRRLGYAPESETHVLDAVTRLELDPQGFDLVISDQTMPGMTGLDFALRIRALRADLPVVLSTGHSAALTPERLREAGVREVIAKPYTMGKLAEVVHRHLPKKPG